MMTEIVGEKMVITPTGEFVKTLVLRTFDEDDEVTRMIRMDDIDSEVVRMLLHAIKSDQDLLVNYKRR